MQTGSHSALFELKTHSMVARRVLIRERESGFFSPILSMLIKLSDMFYARLLLQARHKSFSLLRL